MMFDTHCHLQFNAYKNDAEEVLKRCRDKGMLLNVVGSQRDTSERAVAYAEKHDIVYATVGLHPVHLFSTPVDEEEASFRSRAEVFDYEFYKKLAGHSKVIAIGECGLELHHLPPGKTEEEVLEKQKEVFLAQERLARELSLPLVIHVREAYDEMAEVLGSLFPSLNGVMHCYSGDWERAQKFLDMGLYLGFTGVITFPPKKTNPRAQADLLAVVKKCPLDKILIETDAPYLAPQAYRGQRCEPWMVEEVAKKIAEVRGISPEEVISITSDNARRLFDKVRD